MYNLLLIMSGIFGIGLCNIGLKLKIYGYNSISEWWYCFYTMIAIPIIIATIFPCYLLSISTLIIASIFPFTVSIFFIEALTGLLYNYKENINDGPAGRMLKNINCESNHLLSLDQEINKGTFHILIAAYLDNEINIIESTLDSYTKLKYDNKLTVELIYNTSSDVSNEILEIISSLKEKWNDKQIGPCMFKIVHNIKSKSKAENINYGLSKLVTDIVNNKDDNFDLPDYIGIFDADHHPDSMVIMHAAQLFREGSDIIQGHCTVRNYNDSITTAIVALEFEDLYNLGQEGKTHLYNLALFSGSVGFWRSSILMNIRLDGSMMTEDIDSSFRAVNEGAKITYCHSIKSTELATETFKSLLNQRQRWGQGWLQTSKRHLYKCILSKNTLNYKIGIVLILFWWEIYPYFTFAPIIFSVISYMRNVNLYKPVNIFVFCYYPIFINLLRIAVLSIVADGPITKDKKVSLYFLFYYTISFIYQGLLNIIKVSSHWREFIKKNEWVVTSRGSFSVAPNTNLLK